MGCTSDASSKIFEILDVTSISGTSCSTTPSVLKPSVSDHGYTYIETIENAIQTPIDATLQYLPVALLLPIRPIF